MRKHSKDNSNKLMSSSHDSLSKRQAVLFSFKEIALKEGIASDNADSHEIDNSSEMPVAPFRDPACALKLAGLKDSRVNACVGNKGLMRGEVVNIAYLCKENSPCSLPDAVNRGNNFHFLNSNGLTEIREDAGELIQLIHKVKERRDFLRKDKFLSKTIGSNRAFSGLNNIIGADRDPSTLAVSLKSLCNNLSFSGSDKAGRGELFKKQKHSSSKDITDGLQFREDTLENPLNLVFSRSDKVGDGFSFSCNIPEIFSVLRDGELLNGILVNEDELSNSERVLLVCLGLSQRQLCEIGDQKGINDNGINLFTGQERKEIDMVTACGLHSSHDRGEVFTMRGISSEKPPLSIAADRKKLTAPLASIPVAEKESLETSIPTNSLNKAAPP